MKTSNKLILTAVVIIIISMISYDLALRAEYRKGEYKSRFYRMEKITDLTGYTTIDNRAANYIVVDIEHGKTSEIWTQPNWKENFKVYKNGTTLVIEVVADDVKHPKSYRQGNMTIICPTITQINTKPYLVEKPSGNDYESDGTTTTLKGFDLQNLSLHIGKSSDIVLNGNKIEQLQAVVGEDRSQSSNLTINSDNQINTAKIDVLGKNWLRLENSNIVHKQFTISDSATISMSGNFHNQIKK